MLYSKSFSYVSIPEIAFTSCANTMALSPTRPATDWAFYKLLKVSTSTTLAPWDCIFSTHSIRCLGTGEIPGFGSTSPMDTSPKRLRK